jgi:hypothetical protein
MPSLSDFVRVGKRAIRVLEKGRRRTRTDIHMGLPGHKSNAEGFGCLKDAPVVMRRSEVESGRSAAAKQFDNSQLGCRTDAVAVKGRLIRPGAEPKPVEKFETIRLMAKQRLYDMDVALNKPRKHRRIAGVELSAGIVFTARALGDG